MTLPPLPEPLVMVNRYGQWASTSDGDGGVFTAAQMIAYATAAVLAEREACAKVCDDTARLHYLSSRSCVDYLQTQFRAASDALRIMAENIRQRSAV